MITLVRLNIIRSRLGEVKNIIEVSLDLHDENLYAAVRSAQEELDRISADIEDCLRLNQLAAIAPSEKF